MPEITCRELNGDVIKKVEAEIIDGMFGIHPEPLGWVVTHIPSGLHCIMDYPTNGSSRFLHPFATREQAIKYAECLMSSSLMLMVTTRDDFEKFNSKDDWVAALRGARLMASMA